MGIFNVLDEPVPSTFEQTVTVTHFREGAMSVIDALLKWTPEMMGDEEVSNEN